MATEEPHRCRRRRILQKYPNVKALFGHDPNAKWMCLVLVMSQLYMSTVVQGSSWWVYCSLVYVVGATLTQALFLAVHETAHNLVFQKPIANKWFSLVLNLPIVLPFSIAFRHYHIDHHTYQGVEGLDTDLPTDAEVARIKGRLAKFVWMAFQIVMYAVRPLIHGKNQLRPSWMLFHNVAGQLLFDLLLYHLYGVGPHLYLLACVVVAGGIHPCAGHFLSEHYTFSSGTQETFSYYGKLNLLTWNVGYHNEHHDFPNVSASKLPAVYRTATEFYEPLVKCESWTRTIFKYITNPEYGPHCRVRRSEKDV